MGESADYTDVQHHEGNRAGIVVSVRLKPDESQLLRALSERDGRSMSETLRVALHTYGHQAASEASLTPGSEPTWTRGASFHSSSMDATQELLFSSAA